VNADGTGDRAFLEPPETGAPPGVGTLIEPAWSPLGPIAFNVLDDCPDCAGGSYYATALPDGSEFQQIVPPGDPISPYPVHGLDWSPDGTRWVYTAFARYALYESPGIIVTSTASHTDPRTLTAADAWMPHWSPDGEWIVFLRADGLYLVAADGCHERRLLETPGIRGVDW